MNSINRFKNLFDYDWKVFDYGEWLLVCEIATVWWCLSSDITSDLLNEVDKLEGYERYEFICDNVQAYHDNSVPPSIVEKALEDLNWQNLPVAHGW